jgi:hypothetical protein
MSKSTVVGEPLMAPVEPNLSSLPKNRLSRWQYTEKITRVVSIKTTSGILKRAVNRISILPMDNNHEEADDKVQ